MALVFYLVCNLRFISKTLTFDFTDNQNCRNSLSLFITTYFYFFTTFATKIVDLTPGLSLATDWYTVSETTFNHLLETSLSIISSIFYDQN